jgi:Plavaka transposase
MKCIQLLLGQLAFQGLMDYQPVQLYDDAGNRVYNEISSGNWWWKTQAKISDGGTLIPILLASDKTQLTTYSGDKSGWPLYMSIGNIRKDIRRKISNNAWILIGLLPIPPKGCGRVLSDTIFHRTIDRILRPLAEVDPQGTGHEFHCGDGNIR